MNEKSIFKYKIMENHKRRKKIVDRVDEELNRGLSFVISQTNEKIVSLAGEWKSWVTCISDGDSIHIHVDDKFFISDCILDQILTSLWANLLDFGEIRLEDFQLSENIHSLLISDILEKTSTQGLPRADVPYFGIVFKPSFSLSLKKKIDIAKKFATLGGTFIKEDETYLVGRDKLINDSDAIQEAINTVSDHCFYIPNVTPYFTDESIFQELYKVDILVVMVNYLITGLPTLYKVRKKNNNMLFWGHRVGYRLLERYISMRAMASLAVYSGIDMIHIGTPFLSINGNVEESIHILRAIKRVNKEAIPIFTKTSIHLIPKLIKLFGKNITIMACGSLRTNGYLDWRKAKKWIEVAKSE